MPADNPFVDQTVGIYQSIWASGLRNAYSTAMHPITGQLLGCDVGSNLFEEVNDIQAGRYYGWPEIEGAQTNEVLPTNYQDPLHAYDHDTGCAVIGATFYAADTPNFPPQYHNQFFFADYCEGWIKVMNPQTGEILETFAENIDRPLALLVAPNGDFYYIERAGLGGGSMTDNTSTTNGALWRVQYTGSGAPFISVQPQDQFLPVGEDAVFSVQALGAGNLTYQWQKDEVDIAGANSPALVYPNVQLSDSGSRFRCIIANEEGILTSGEAELEVTANTRPILSISLPELDATYSAGDTIFFAGSATDAEDGIVATENLRWFIDFHHDDHTHPALENFGGQTEGYLIVPRIGEVDDNVWYRVYLVAEDSEGLTQTAYREVYPEKTTFDVFTEPDGLRINVDGQAMDSPAEVTSVVGIRRTLSAPLHQVDDNTIYTFQGWENLNDGNRLFTFFAGEQSSTTAQYE
ncbi:MAG: PQQ-dependent sugar dehydrogenase, partial [Bacteroidota bacterium]